MIGFLRVPTKRFAAGVSAGLAGFVIVGGGVALATGTVSDSSKPVVIQALPGVVQSTPTYSRNATGQTYGSLLDSTSSATDPTLAQVIATNGETGYVYTSQLDQAPSSPTAALAQQAADTNGRYIPVYATDGTTVIGQFEATEPVAQTTTPPK